MGDIFGNIFEEEKDEQDGGGVAVASSLEKTQSPTSGGAVFDDIFKDKPLDAARDVVTETKEKTKQDDGFFKSFGRSVLEKTGSAAKAVTKWGLDLWNKQSEKNDIANFKMRELMYGDKELVTDPETGKKSFVSPRLQAFESATTDEERAAILHESNQDVPLIKFFNSKAGKATVTAISEKTSNIPLKTMARIQSIGDRTYEEAYGAWLDERNDPDNPTWQKFLFELQDTGIQSGIGILMTVGISAATRNPKAGLGVSSAYYTALSADEQIQSRGQVESIGNIAIDVVGDQLINKALLGVLGSGSKSAIIETLKGFGIEGTTEVAQSLLKYSNDYGNARTDEERQAVLTEAENYVKNGGMAMEFAVGGTVGGVAGGITSAVAGGSSSQPNDATTKKGGTPKPHTPNTAPVSAEVENADIDAIVTELVGLEQTLDVNDEVATNRVARLRDTLNDYTATFRDKTVFVPSDVTTAPLVEVVTSQLPSGKVVVKFSANTKQNSFSSEFDYSQLFNTQEEATKSAKEAIVAWANSQETTDVDEQAALAKIADFVENPRSPVEKPLQKPKEKTEAPPTEFDTVHRGGEIKKVKGELVQIADGVETFVHKGDGGFVVSEVSSGMFIADSLTKAGAISKAGVILDEAGTADIQKRIDKGRKIKEDAIKKSSEVTPKKPRSKQTKSEQPTKKDKPTTSKKGSTKPSKKKQPTKKRTTPTSDKPVKKDFAEANAMPSDIKKQKDVDLNALFLMEAVLGDGRQALKSKEYKELTRRGYSLKDPKNPREGFAFGKKEVKAPSGTAQMVFSESDLEGGGKPEKGKADIPIEMGQMDGINPIEMPELVELARELMGGQSVQVTKLRGGRGGGLKLGDFKPAAGGRIRLADFLFKQDNLPEAAKTLAHELGHLVDYLPNQTMARGNLLGRLGSLRGFMQSTFSFNEGKGLDPKDRAKIRSEARKEVAKELGKPQKDFTLADKRKAKDLGTKRIQEAIKSGGFITDAKVRKELLTLTRWWHPYNPEKVSASYRQYRESSVELYAEALSVLFTAPKRLQDIAPTFYENFFKGLDAKPEMRDAYFEVQALLSGDRELVVKRRREGVKKMFKDGDKDALDLHNKQVAEKENRRKQYWSHFKHTVIDKNFQIIDRVKKVQKEGKTINPDENPAFFLEERNYLGGKIKALFEREFNTIYSTLNENEIAWSDFGEVLFYERIAAGDRSDVANPRGITPEAATELLDTVKKEYGAERWAIIQEQVERFRAANKKVTEDAFKAGLYKKELYENMQENPAYVTFQVLDHLEEGMNSRVYKSLGTLKDVTNPADATMLKVISTIRAAERNVTTKKTVDFLKANFEEDIVEANYAASKKGRFPIPSKIKNQELITFMEEGVVKGYYVDPYIAETINNQSVGANAPIVPVIRFMNTTLFRPLFISFNLGFQSFNLIRDFVRFYKNTPDMTFLRAMQRYGQSTRVAKIRAFGLPKNPSQKDQEAFDFINKLEEEKVLSVTFNDMIKGETTIDRQVEKILADTGVKEFQPKPTIEKLPKFAKPAAKVLNKVGILDVASNMLGFIENLGNLIETLPKAAGIIELTQDGDLTIDEKSFVRRKIGSPDFLAGGTYKPITNEVFLFSNAIIQGIRSDIEVATDPQTRAGWWWKTAKITFLPKLLMMAVTLGLLGDEYEELMEGASEYDKTNYIIIPLGRDSNGKPIYFRLPQDESSRFLGGIFWKALTIGRDDRSIGRDIMDVASYTGGQLPSISPAIESISATAQFLSGENPYDFFRGRPALSETTHKAGGLPATKAFLGWQFQQLGGGIFYRFYHEPSAKREEGAVEKFFNAPVIGNVLGRFVRVSDFGEVEQLRNIEDKVEKEKAKESLKDKALINKYIDQAREENIRFSTAELENALVTEKFDGFPNTKEDIADAKSLVKKFQLTLRRGNADPNVSALVTASSNDVKLEILKKIQGDMDAVEFDALRTDLIQSKIVSGEVFNKLLQETVK